LQTTGKGHSNEVFFLTPIPDRFWQQFRLIFCALNLKTIIGLVKNTHTHVLYLICKLCSFVYKT